MPVMFRCFQCNQVLKTGRAKSGSVVACPKCGVELVVPEPAAKQSVTDMTSRPTDPTDLIRAVVTPKPAFEFPDIRPEDIRVVPGVAASPAPPPPPPRAPAEPPSPPARPAPEVKLDSSPEPAPAPTPPGPEPEFPPIHIEPQPIKPETPSTFSIRANQPRGRDAVIPHAALVGWSLFGLLALVMAFLAGLL